MTEIVPHAPLIPECRAALLRTFDTLAAELGCNRHAEALRDAAATAFDELAGTRSRRSFQDASDMTASRIGLVDEDALNLTLELDELARRLRERCDLVLGRLQQRFSAISALRGNADDDMPVGAETVCRALRGLVEALGLHGEERSVFIAKATPPLLDHLEVLYAKLDERFDSAGLGLPARSHPIPPPGASARNSTQAAPFHCPELALGPAHGRPVTPFEGLQHALTRRRSESATQTSPLLDPQLASSIVDQIRAWLSAQQRLGLSQPVRLGASNFGHLLAPEAAAAIETLEHVFDRIATNTESPPGIVQAIGSLRIPYLKLALDDTEFLGEPDHPALALIEGLARAGNTLPLTLPEHPGFATIRSIVARHVLEAPPERSALVAARDATAAFALGRREAAHERASPALELAAKAEKREGARLLASRALAALIDGDTPEVVRDFLLQEWIQVLVGTLYRHGDKHPDWRLQLEIAHELVDVMRPASAKNDSSNGTQAFAALTVRIRAALAASGFDRGRRDAAFALCSALHADINAGRAPAQARSAPVPTAPVLVAAREQPGVRMLYHTGYAAPQGALGALAETLQVDHWAEILLDEKPPFLGCITWVGPGQRTVLLADPDSEMVLVATVRSLADLAREGRFTLRCQHALAARAAETLLHDLKG